MVYLFKIKYMQNNNLIKKDSLYKKLWEIFPWNFYKKFKRINVVITSIIFSSLLVYLIICSFLNINILWYISIAIVLLLIFVPLILVKINCYISMKKFLNNVAFAFQDQKIKIVHKNLYKKRTPFPLALIEEVYSQIK